MKLRLLMICFGAVSLLCVRGQTNSPAASAPSSVQTIICIRHGEKPTNGLGQLTCKGLNRALALPKVLLPKYGKPQFVFAPNPTQKVDGNRYDYVRPLATIEPIAIQCGLPVNTEFGFREIAGLENELKNEKYQRATIFVAWEHVLLDNFAKNLLKDNGGNPQDVAPWPESDYDTIFVFKITHAATGDSVTFKVEHEGLDGLSDDCP